MHGYAARRMPCKVMRLVRITDANFQWARVYTPACPWQASQQTAQGVSVCVCQFSLCCNKHTHACTTDQGAKGHTFNQYWKRANVTIDLNGKTTSCDGMQPDRLKRTTSHLAPHLGGVAANIGTLNRAGAYTLARACANALQTCLSTHMLTQQAFGPLVDHDC